MYALLIANYTFFKNDKNIRQIILPMYFWILYNEFYASPSTGSFRRNCVWGILALFNDQRMYCPKPRKVFHTFTIKRYQTSLEDVDSFRIII